MLVSINQNLFCCQMSETHHILKIYSWSLLCPVFPVLSLPAWLLDKPPVVQLLLNNNFFLLMGQLRPLDLQRGKVWECGRLDRPHAVVIVSKCHQLRGQTEIAANSGSISSWDYCLVNECFSMWLSCGVFISARPYRFLVFLLIGLITPRTHLPSIDISRSVCPVCVCRDELCAEYFALVSCI